MAYSFNQQFVYDNLKLGEFLGYSRLGAFNEIYNNLLASNPYPTQKDVLQALYDDAIRVSPTIEFHELYRYVHSEISDLIWVSEGFGYYEAVPKASLLSNEQSAWLWVQGAIGVNSNDGEFFSDFIRDYTVAQFEERYQTALSEPQILDKIQDASDDIVAAFIRDILDINELGQALGINTDHEIPSVAQIGLYDAGGVAANVFDELPSIDLGGNYAPWAGTILFPFLGVDSFTRDWLFNNNQVINPGEDSEYFKPLEGTYDLISVASASWEVTNLLAAWWNSGALADTLANNNLGTTSTLALLANLRNEATTYFQNSYGVSDEERFRIGGDLPLYGEGTTWDAISDFLNGGSSNFFDITDRPDYIVGTLGDDTNITTTAITGLEAALSLVGYESAGSDIVNAGLGNDVIFGSVGSDLIDGAEGTDQVSYRNVGLGLDVIFTDVFGAEALYDERIETFHVNTDLTIAFTDYLYGIEELILTSSIDTIRFDSGDANRSYIIDGAGGDDIFDFSSLTSSVTVDIQAGIYGTTTFTDFQKFIGGAGNDVFIDADGAHDYDGGDGLDEVSYVNVAGNITADLASGTVTSSRLGAFGKIIDTITNIEGITGTALDDRFYSIEGAQNIFFDGLGNSGYVNQLGQSVNGRDVVDFSRYSNGGVTVNFTGTGTASGSDALGGSFALTGIEEIIGTNSRDIMNGHAGTNWLKGMDGDDDLSGGAGDDILEGGSGDDTLLGGDGNDTYYYKSGSHDDVITDTSGLNDRLYFDGLLGFDPTQFSRNLVNSEMSIVNIGTVTNADSIERVEYADGAVFQMAGLGLDVTQYDNVITGTSADATINGTALNDHITGGTGQETLFGDAGFDYIVGNGSDILLGGDGEDYLFGGEVLDGGSGNDFLTSSAQNATYVASGGIDVIADNGVSSTLLFDGLSLSSLSFFRSSNDSLIIEHSGSSKVIVQNYFGGNEVEFISFDSAGAGSDLFASLTDVGFLPQEFAENTFNGGNEDNIYVASALDESVYAGLGANEFDISAGISPLVSGNHVFISSDVDAQQDIIRLSDVNDIQDVKLVYDNARTTLYHGDHSVTINNALAAGQSTHYAIEISTGQTYNLGTLDLIIQADAFSSDGQPNAYGDVAGFSFDNIIYGHETSSRSLYGYTGNDTIYGLGAVEYIYGGTGNDTLDGGGNDDIISGGAGADLFIDTAGNDTYYVDNTDTLRLGEGINHIIAGEDESNTVSNADLSGLNIEIPNIQNFSSINFERSFDASNNHIYTLNYAGNSLIIGDYENLIGIPTITLSDTGAQQNIKDFTVLTDATQEDNLLFSESFYDFTHDDMFYLGGGFNIAVFSGGNDIVYGNTGQDWISSSSATAFTAYGGAGDDVLTGGSGDDILEGGNDNDILISGTGYDQLKGDAGDDIFYVNPDANDLVDGGDGLDTISFGAPHTSLVFTETLTIDLEEGLVQSEFGDFTIENIENITGSEQVDHLIGDSQNNYFEPLGGDDQIEGGLGDDRYLYFFNYGENTIFDTGGSDVIELPIDDSIIPGIVLTPMGSDFKFEYTGANAAYILKNHFANPDNQIESIYFQGSGTTYDLVNYASWYTAPNITTLTATASAEAHTGTAGVIDAVDYSGSALSVIIDLLNGTASGGHADGDTLTSIENLVGTDFDDLLKGDSFDNVLDGDLGNDELRGGDGTDTIYGGAGIDKIRGDGGNDYIYAGSGADTDVNGGTGNDFLSGESGDDKLRGGDDHDEVYGGAGNDFLYGDNDASDLTGGDDLLDGGSGDDSLRGGFGNDTYVFSAGSDNIIDLGGVDTLRFRAGYNLIDLDIQIDAQDIDSLLITSGLDVVRITNHLTAGSTIENITFADGSYANLGDWVNWRYISGGLETGSTLDDTIIADVSASVTFNGLEGNDALFGNNSNDHLRGGDGDDLLHGGLGFDTAYYKGVYADYSISGNTVQDLIGGEGTDSLISIERLQFYDGTYENGLFTASSTDELFFATAKADILDGGSGSDTVNYSGSDDGITIDLLNGIASGGYAKGDVLYAIENITGSIYADTLAGDAGNNILNGSWGDDTYIYNGGLDTLADSGGTDTLILSNALASDVAMTFDNNDLVITINSGTDEVRITDHAIAASVIETIQFSDGFYADLSDPASWIYSNDTLNAVSGSNATDVIILGSLANEGKGFDGDDYIYGGDGNDTLRGYEGADVLFGGAGIDKIVGGLGNDILNGGAGDDTDFRGEEGNDILYGGDGNDKLRGDDTADTITGHDQLYGQAGNDELLAGLGNDILDGGAGDDSLYGYSGNDTYIASGGADYVREQLGYDVIEFGEGITIFDLSFANDPTDTNDQIITIGTDTIHIENQTESSGDYAIEELRFFDGTYANFADILDWEYAVPSGGVLHGSYSLDDVMIGDIGNDSFYGKDGNDQLYGGAGDDYLRGDAHNDLLVGGAGNDSLKGDGGDDILMAGSGADRLEAHAGADTFLFYGSEIVDGNLNRVVDFNGAEGDVIRLENILENYDPLTDSISDFIQMSTTSHTYLDIDIDGQGTNHSFVEDVIRIENINTWTDVDDMITQGHLLVA